MKNANTMFAIFLYLLPPDPLRRSECKLYLGGRPGSPQDAFNGFVEYVSCHFFKLLISHKQILKSRRQIEEETKERTKEKKIIGNISIVFCHVTFSKSLGLSTVPFHPGPAGV